jgi:hypothetical protein
VTTEKVPDGNFSAEEANILAIPAPCIGKANRPGNGPNLHLRQVTDGKEETGKDLPTNGCQKIGLVLGPIEPGMQGAFASTASFQPAVVPRRKKIAAGFQNIFQETAKFNVPIAEHVRIGGYPTGVASDERIYHTIAVVGHHANDAKRNSEKFCDGAGTLQVLPPGTFSGAVLTLPGAHVDGFNGMPLLQKKMDSNGTVNAAGNCHANPPHGKNLRPPTATFVNENFLGGNDPIFQDMDAIPIGQGHHIFC